jgi:hypothetical protein
MPFDKLFFCTDFVRSCVPSPDPLVLRLLGDQTNCVLCRVLQFAGAGDRNTFLCFSRDQWGNLIVLNDYSAAFSMTFYEGAVRISDGLVRTTFRNIRAGVYEATFSATTNTGVTAYVQVFLSDTRYGLSK